MNGLKKSQRIINIINLLYNRRFVTKKDILKHCKISRRTFYRDINDISELNIPVYYDKQLEGYRLNTQKAVRIDNLGIDDIVMVIVGLSLLSHKVNKNYYQSLKPIINKIMSPKWLDLSEYLNAHDFNFENKQKENSMDELINMLKIQLAISSERSIVIYSSQKKATVTKPKMIFNNNWFVYDGNDAESRKFVIGDLAKVKII